MAPTLRRCPPRWFTAWGIDTEGKPVLSGLGPGVPESGDAWCSFLAELSERGMPARLLAISDGGKGLRAAIERCFPRSLHQRCTAHVGRNVLAKVPTHAQADVKGDYWAIFDPIEGEGPKALAEGRRRSHPALHREVEAALPLRRRLRGGEPRGVARLPGLLHRAPQAHPALQPHRADLRGDPTPSEGDRPPPGEQSCLSLFWAVLDRASKGWQALTMSLKAFRLLQDLRSQLLEAASCSPTWARR